jgi:hypothetical protein
MKNIAGFLVLASIFNLSSKIKHYVQSISFEKYKSLIINKLIFNFCQYKKILPLPDNSIFLYLKLKCII